MDCIEKFTPAKGTLTILGFNRRGELVIHQRLENLLVNGFRTVVPMLIADPAANAATKRITKIGFGTNGTAPVVTNTALTSAFVKDISTRTVDGGTFSVSFAWSLGFSEGNSIGASIREFGLLTTDSTLVARRLCGAIDKTSELSLQGTWVIDF